MAYSVSSEQIIKEAVQAGRELKPDTSLDERFMEAEGQATALADYLNLLIKWNKSMNLVGPSGWEEIFHSLITDSLYLADFLKTLDLPESPRTLDLGAGAGLPGIPLRCVWQNGSYLLVESRQKRSIFMRTVLRSIKLPGTDVFQGRAEKIPQAELPADLIISKAFMPWKELLPFVIPMLGKGGRVIILSNDLPPDSAATEKFGFKVEKHTTYSAGNREHYLWALKNIA
ncbi:16S rRNA (guanine(527)-N(7))-methyltransferase RsmG [Maridesulfovibrio sp.]|uniref:16S rRNA (guanine(527)-N(7))-methyltransferase RsmG n=1 Tax=Maridesulfovibrio sp. TaxID=2795000 RepID=UPI002A187A43|nr:16S rRNA (guanine(527)-N(7))-methyltransferase RsmG [Maridesulfovibrio sp.]